METFDDLSGKKFRKKRRETDMKHVPFYWENGDKMNVFRSRQHSSSSSSFDGGRPEKDLLSPDAELKHPKPDIALTSPNQKVPKLDLDHVDSPSPELRIRRHSLSSDKEERQVIRRSDLCDASVQTSLSLVKAKTKDAKTQTPSKWRHNGVVDVVPFPVTLRRDDPSRHVLHHRHRYRSRSPFAPYAIGDKEITVAGKRTFNVKADGSSKQIYETAKNAARLQHIPLHHSRNKYRSEIRSRHISNSSKNRDQFLH